MLAHIDYLDGAIAELSTEIEAQIARLAPAVEALCTIPGVHRRTAEVIIAETGGDMRAFLTAKHLASWAGVCPGNDESAGKRRSGKTRKGSKWLRANLIEAATAATRTKDTYLQAQYQRLRARRGQPRRDPQLESLKLRSVALQLGRGPPLLRPASRSRRHSDLFRSGLHSSSNTPASRSSIPSKALAFAWWGRPRVRSPAE